jgi:hypothetical protein
MANAKSGQPRCGTDDDWQMMNEFLKRQAGFIRHFNHFATSAAA